MNSSSPVNNRFSRSRPNELGFTLIEGIVASGIISTALIVGLALAYSNLTASRANSDRIIAANLAREALEVVRNIRDSNWLRLEANIDKDAVAADTQFYAWDDFFDCWPNYDTTTCVSSTPGNYFDVVMTDPNFSNTSYNYSLKLVTSVNRDTLTCIQDSSQLACHVRRKGSLYYQSAAGSDPFTPFYRRVILKPVCWNGTDEIVDFDALSPDMLCPTTYTRVGVLVTAEVVWQRDNKTLNVQLKERLYNWRTRT